MSNKLDEVAKEIADEVEAKLTRPERIPAVKIEPPKEAELDAAKSLEMTAEDEAVLFEEPVINKNDDVIAATNEVAEVPEVKPIEQPVAKETKVTIRKPGKDKEPMPEVKAAPASQEKVQMPEMTKEIEDEFNKAFSGDFKIDANEVVQMTEQMGSMAEMMADMQGLKGKQRETFIQEAQQAANEMKREIDTNGADAFASNIQKEAERAMQQMKKDGADKKFQEYMNEKPPTPS